MHRSRTNGDSSVHKCDYEIYEQSESLDLFDITAIYLFHEHSFHFGWSCEHAGNLGFYLGDNVQLIPFFHIWL